MDAGRVGQMLAATVRALTDSCASLDSVAIPSFGSFIPDKQDEHIESDRSDNSRVLVPPCIDVQFRPSVVLRKSINR